MKNQALSSSDYGKLLIFSLSLLPLILILVGILPIIIIAFGLYMNNRNRNFSHIETAYKHTKIYFTIVTLGLLAIALINTCAELLNEHDFSHALKSEKVIGPSISAIASALYLWFLFTFFYNPLKKHSTWVSENGLFPKQTQFNNALNKSDNMNIIKGEKLKQYSVADELIKWSQLKENGYITEDEYNKARAKLLKNN